MENVDQFVLAVVSAAGGVAGWKGLMLILSRLGLGLAQNKNESDALSRLSSELDKAHKRADAEYARAVVSDDRASKAVSDMAEMRSLLDKLNYQVEHQQITIERQASAMAGMEKELNLLREMVRNDKRA